jgi:hypothetical protein
MKLLPISVLLIFTISFTNAQEFRIYSNEFLNIGAGARAMGMANAYTSASDDVSSAYWNPAGLMKIENNLQIMLMHSEYFAGIANYDFGAFAAQINPESRIAFSVVRMGVDDIPNTLELIDAEGRFRYDLVKSFSAIDYAFTASYARQMADEKLRIGASTKVIHRRVGTFANSWGFGFDAGLQYDFSDDFTIGIMGRDITTTFNAWSFSLTDDEKAVFSSTGNEIPVNSVELTAPKVLTGISKNWHLSEKFNLITAFDLDFHFDGIRNTLINSKSLNLDPHLGIELGFMDLVFLRSGIMNLQRSTTNSPSDNNQTKEIFTFQPNVGIGIKYQNLALDYAFTDIGNQSVALYSHIISLRFGIDKRE